MQGSVRGRRVVVGKRALLERSGVRNLQQLDTAANDLQREGHTVIWVAVEGDPAGLLAVSDPIKSSTPEAIENLHRAGLKIIMLTGDNKETARQVASRLGIDEVVAEITPAEKQAKVLEFKSREGIVAMAGDGVNDAPALAAADVGIAMGTGTDVAMHSAGVTLVKGDLRGIVHAIALSRATMRNIRQNLWFAFLYNGLGVPIAAGVLYPFLGLLLSPIFASAAMALSSVSVIAQRTAIEKELRYDCHCDGASSVARSRGSSGHFGLALSRDGYALGRVACPARRRRNRSERSRCIKARCILGLPRTSPATARFAGWRLSPSMRESRAWRSDPGIVALNPRSVDVLAVTTVPVRRLDLTKSLRFSGILEDDENIHRIIAAFYDGRIDEIYVEHVGQYVEKGQPLAAIYSPELLYVVREYQNALASGDPAVARNSAQRLVQYGLSPEQVAALARQPDNVYTIDLLAPISGTVLTKKAFKGQYIKTGEPLFEMGNLSRLWFHAEVYERDLPDIRIGQKATLTTPTVPGREFEGTVTFIDPNFDPRTRSTKVRIEVDNPPVNGEQHGLQRVLPHRAYAEAEIAANFGEALVIPRSAVLRDGRRSVVYVEKSPGAYEQRSVKTGRVGDEGIEILDGLKDGERVVAQGNLMIDAEAQLRGSVAATQSMSALSKPVGEEFLRQLAQVSEGLGCG